MAGPPAKRASSIADAFIALYKLVQYLRGEHGCPWDREQSVESMRDCLDEEILELGEEIDKGRREGISEEWGDVLFILLMIAVIGEQKNLFDTEKAMRSIETKMIRRHPHVFGGSDVDSAEDTIPQWEDIKAREKVKNSPSHPSHPSLMDDIPMFYSSAKRADHVQKAAAAVGFDWPDRGGVLDKIEEELAELRVALDKGSAAEVASELGDLLFSCVNLARFENLDADTALSKTVDKFVERFRYVETELRGEGKSPAESSLEEMDKLWERAKSVGVPPAPPRNG
jgi:tetrapyrrole methylase family protein/MazG family protein